jgi:LysM repeat protein
VSATGGGGHSCRLAHELAGVAAADFAHTVTPGESLTSVAAADGLSVDQLAAANGLSPDAQLITGSTVQIPPQSAATPASVGTGDDQPTAAPAEASPASAAPATQTESQGGYVVQPGDTLSAIAAANGLTVDQLAAANGLDPNGILLAGSSLNVSGGPASAPTADQSVATPAAPTPAGSAQPTAQTVSASDVGQIAADNGVPSSLAEAIGYQESGFNNDLVSSTGATGVMQIEPGTWSYINQNLVTPPPLSPSSAQDNIRGGVLLLRSLLDQTGGDSSLAAAGYYQGLESVRQNGMFAGTQQYVANVMALQQRFGGP